MGVLFDPEFGVVDCNDVLEGSAPNADTGECECPNNQIPSVDGTKCECPNGQGLVDGSDDCVQCNEVLEGSNPNPETGKCECPEGQNPNVYGKKCEVKPDTGTDTPPCLAGEWYALVKDWEGGDKWCNSWCCAPGCDVASGCCSYENGVSTHRPGSTVGSPGGVHENCWDENPDPQKFPAWYHGCALCPGLDAGSQEKECLEGEGWIDDPKNCVDCDTVLKDSFPNAETGECECPEGQNPSGDGKRCEIEQDETPKTTWCAIPCWEGYTNQANGGGCDPSCPEGCSDAFCESICPNHPACDDTGNLDQNWFRCQLCSTIKSPNPKCNKPQQAQGDCAALRLDDVLLNGTSSDDGTGGKDCTDPTGCSEEDPTEMPSATPDRPSLLGSDSGSDAAAEETPSTTATPPLPGSDSGSDAAAEETPSTTDTPSLLGSDSASDAAAEETPSTTATPPLPGSDTPTVNAN